MNRVIASVVVPCAAGLTACAHVGERQFAETVSRFQSDATYRAEVTGPQLWITETTVWQDAAGFDRTISCTAIRPVDWLATRGYRLIPAAEEAAREGLVVTRKTHSPTTADVSVGRSKAPPDAIYSFFRDEGTWELTGAEFFNRRVTADTGVPDYRCLATE